MASLPDFGWGDAPVYSTVCANASIASRDALGSGAFKDGAPLAAYPRPERSLVLGAKPASLAAFGSTDYPEAIKEAFSPGAGPLAPRQPGFAFAKP